MRGVAGGEAADLLARIDVEDVDDVAGRGRDGDGAAVGRDGHVIRALAVDLKAPLDLAARQVEPDHVAQAGPGDDQQPPVVSRVHVVDELVVALADELADREEVAEALGVEHDLGHPLLEVGDDVDAGDAPQAGAQLLGGAGVLLHLAGLGAGEEAQHVRGPLPVVADEDDLARLRPLRLLLGLGDGRLGGGRGEPGEERGRHAAGEQQRRHQEARAPSRRPASPRALFQASHHQNRVKTVGTQACGCAGSRL